MSPSLSLEEKLDVVLKSNHEITSSNQELKSSNQELKAKNEYLCKQLGTFLKQKQKMCEEPVQSERRRQEQVFNHTLHSSSEDEPVRIVRQDPRMQASSNDLELKFQNMKASLTQKSSWTGFTRCKECLNTRTFLKTRK